MLARSADTTHEDVAADEAADADAEALAEYEAKGGVSHEAILAWVRSWGKEGELPPPNAGD